MPRTSNNALSTKFCDLKGAFFCVDFGEANPIRLTPMGANEPKSAKKPPFKAGSILNALAIVSTVVKSSEKLTQKTFTLRDTPAVCLYALTKGFS